MPLMPVRHGHEAPKPFGTQKNKIKIKISSKHFHSTRKKLLLNKYKLYTPCPVLGRNEPCHTAKTHHAETQHYD